MNVRRDLEATILRKFLVDTATHTMEIVLDNGVHRHLRFSRPKSSSYHFDIVTWPGYLAITGDMGAAVFSRLHDMFDFFRRQPEDARTAGRLYINSGYWAEKCVANEGLMKEFSSELLECLVRDHFDDAIADADQEKPGFEAAKDALWEALQDKVISGADSVRDAIEAMDDFSFADYCATHCDDQDHAAHFAHLSGPMFPDAWEYASSLEHYTHHFIWRLYAIAHAVRAYDEAKATVATEAQAVA